MPTLSEHPDGGGHSQSLRYWATWQTGYRWQSEALYSTAPVPQSDC